MLCAVLLWKVLIYLFLLPCECAYAPLCVPEPTPWVSGVGLSRGERSRIKSILILARQEPLLLLGDTSTEREEKRVQTLLLLLLPLSSPLSQFCTLQLSLLHIHLLAVSLSPSFSSPFLLPHCLMWPSLSSTVAAPYFSLLTPLVSAPQWGVAGTVVQQTALCELQGSLEVFSGFHEVH